MTAAADTITVLHVGGGADSTGETATALEREDDIEVVTAPTASDGLDRLAEGDVDCVVSEYDLPGTNGVEFLEAVREADPDIPFVLFTGAGSETVASEAISAGVTEYVQKDGEEQFAVLANRIRDAVGQSRRRSHHRSGTSGREQFRIFDNSPAPIAVFDGDGTLDYANGAAARMLGADSPDEFIGHRVLEFVHPDSRDVVQERMYQVVRQREPVPAIEETLVGVDGRQVDAVIASAPVTYDGKEGGQAIIVDVTELKETRERLVDEQTFVQEALDALDDVFYVIDTDGQIVRVNDKATEVSGYTEEEILSMEPTDFFKPEDRDRVVADIQKAFETGQATIHAEVLTKDGKTVPFEFRKRRLTDRNGEVVGVVGIGRDVSDRQARERELERQNERLEEFASIVSHDLRNPLSVAQGYLDLVRKDCDTEHLGPVERALDRMDALIEDLLTLARQGQAVSDFEPIAIGELVEECWQTVDTANATLDVETDLVVEADRSRLRQLLENLLRNAVEHGGETVTVTVGSLPNGFYVADDGPGIPPERREKVFESGYSTSEKGTGFGLSIVKQIAEAHGWNVSVTDSEVGGARFAITGVDTARSGEPTDKD